MSNMTLIILLVNVFLIGAIAVVAAWFVRAHYQQKGNNIIAPKKEDPEPDFPKLQIPPEIIKKITQESEAHYLRVLANSAAYLQQSLVGTATDVNNQVRNLVTKIINEELEHYRQDMDKMRQQAVAELGGVKAEMDSHKQELRAKLAQEIEVEKQQMVKQIDTKLSDAVASFLVETLGHNVDLGNQNDYLTALLEEHKADLVKEVAAPAEAPKTTAQPPVSEVIATSKEAPDETKPAA